MEKEIKNQEGDRCAFMFRAVRRDDFQMGKRRTLKHMYLFIYYTPTHTAPRIQNTIRRACTQIYIHTHKCEEYPTTSTFVPPRGRAAPSSDRMDAAAPPLPAV